MGYRLRESSGGLTPHLMDEGTALVDWWMWKSNGTLGTLRYLREVYWHQLISQGSLLAVATVFQRTVWEGKVRCEHCLWPAWA